MAISVQINMDSHEDLVQFKAVDGNGNMISSEFKQIERPPSGRSKTVVFELPDALIEHVTKKKEYFAIGRKNGREFVQISRENDGKRTRTDPIEIPWKPDYATMFLEVTDDKFKEYSETESIRNLRDDSVDALRYATAICDTHPGLYPNIENLCFGNHNTRQKEKPMKTKKDIDRIVITKNDLNEVLLRAFSGDEIVEKTIAKCSPEDMFDFNIGAKLAVDRLYDGYDMTPKSKRKPYNGKIFIRMDVRKFSFLSPDYRARENKIWEVKGGKIIDFDRAADTIYEDMTDEELAKLLCSTNNCFRGYFYNIVDGYFVR